MKRIAILIIFLTTAIAASAQSVEKIKISNVAVLTDTETVDVTFRANIDHTAAAKGSTVVYAPVITDGQYKVSLPSIVVQRASGRRNWSRHEWAAGTQASYENGIYVKNGDVIDYSASVPFQPWMYDSRIDVEVVNAGCCNTNTELLALANMPSAPEPEPEPVPEKTIAEFLAETFPFVLPASEYDPWQPLKFYNDERDNSLIVYYKINKYDIEPDYVDNRQTLINLVAAIKLIRESENADVKRVVVAGFASPEGPLTLNDRLGWERAVSVKEYILENTDMPDEDISLFNGSADWNGLRRMIADDANVPYRNEALVIIDNNPIWNTRTMTGRMTLLKNLRGGTTYNYLKAYIFPKLRNGAFIRVYFEEK